MKKQKRKRRMMQFSLVVITACILCGMCVVVLVSNPAVNRLGSEEMAVNPVRAMIAAVFAMFCGVLAIGYRHIRENK